MAENPGFFRKLLGSIWPKDRGRGVESRLSGAGLSSTHATKEGLPADKDYPAEIDCPEVREMASDYVEESLSEGLVAAMRRHLAECKNCTSFINTFRRTIDMVRGLPLAKAPGRLRRSILDEISKPQS